MSEGFNTHWQNFGSTINKPDKLSFTDISQKLWQEIRKDSPFDQGDPACGEFKSDFYGKKRIEPIDYKKVVKFIKDFNEDNRKVFNWETLTPNPVYEPKMRVDKEGFLHKTGQMEARYYMVPYEYTDEIGTNVIAKIGGNLNKRICYLESDTNKQWSFRLDLNATKRNIEAIVSIYYKDTYDKREDASDTKPANDFRIYDEYRAIILTMDSFNDFAYLIRDIYGEKQFKLIRSRITDEFLECLKVAKTPGDINFIYKKMPEFVVREFAARKLIKKEMFVKHLLVLEVRDAMSWTKDSSPAVINLLRCLGDPKLLYQLAKNYPEAVKEFFYNLDKSSTFNGQELTNKTIFAIIFLVICQVNNYEGYDKTKAPVFKIGPGFRVDNHIRPSRDKYIDAYTLTQQELRTRRELITAGKDGQWYESFTEWADSARSGYFYPLEPVYFIDLTSGSKTPMLVPAIFVKAIAHQQKVADIMNGIRVLADLLAIILGIASLGSGSALYIFLGLLDIGIAVKDLDVMSREGELMKTAEGRKYLENWNTFALVGGILTAGPILIRGTYLLGAKLLGKVTIAETKNFLQSTIKGMLLETGVTGFIPESIKVLEVADVAALSKLGISSSEAAKLYDAGIIFVKGETQVAGKTVEEIAVVYKGEVIAKGEASQVANKMNGLKKSLAEGIEEILDGMSTEKHFVDIAEFRELKNLPKYIKENGATGTVAKVQIEGKIFYGLNSGASPESLVIRKKWFDKIQWVPPKKTQPVKISQAQSLLHAEGHALINAFEEIGELPEKLTLYVDRPTCNMCKGELPALMKTMNIKELTLIHGDSKLKLILNINF